MHKDEGWGRVIGSLGLADEIYYIGEWINNKSYCIAQGTLFDML